MVQATSPPPYAPADATLRPKPPQFSMQTLLAVVTVVALATAVLQLVPWAAHALVTLICGAFVPVCVGTLAIYCRGYRRTFFSAALAGLAWPLIMLWGAGRLDWGELLAIPVIEALGIVGCGAVAVATRRFIERRRWHLAHVEDENRR